MPTGETPPVTRHIADFASSLRFEDIPDGVVARGGLHILDSLGLALAGAGSPVCRVLHDHLAASGIMDGPSAIFGTGWRATARFAAQANATAIHAENFDDTHPQALPGRNGGIHATGPVLAATLAVAETAGATGRETLTAFHAGVEVACRLSQSIAARHYDDGFHTTGTLTIFGAAVAAGRLLGLDSDGLVHALAGAASRAGGIRRNFGTMVEPLHAGNAAENGVATADLAVRGLTGAEHALEGPVGYFQAAGGGWDAEAIVGRLGAPWGFTDPGMWIKPFPNGALTHPAMTRMLEMIEAHDLSAERVSAVRVRTNRRMLNTLIHHRPETGLQAKFSMEFALAILLLDGAAGLAAFTEEVVRRADVQDMIRRVDYGAFDQPGPDYTNVTTLLEIDLSDGTALDGRADFAKGSSRDPMSMADIANKFRQCAAYADWPDDKADRIIDAVAGLEELSDVSEMTTALTV